MSVSMSKEMNSDFQSGSEFDGESQLGQPGADVVLPEQPMWSRKDKCRVWAGRVAVILLVLGVTLSTYFILNDQENDNFETAFAQFARTLGDAALDQQQDLRDSIHSLATAITVNSLSSNATWPFYALPMFESFARDFKILSRAEFVGLNNIVQHADRDSYTDYANENYRSWIESGHLLAYGNLDLLNTDESKYHPYISQRLPNRTFVPDVERETYHVRTLNSPPPRAFGPLTNWNIGHSASNEGILEQLLTLRNETLIGEFRSFQSLPPEEHQNFHTDSSVSHPHSFVYYPIHQEVQDYYSDIVATIAVVVAWDASMLDLLPDNVHGIYCVIKNNCNQVHTYEVNGKDAIYKGADDLHDSDFDDMEVFVDLALHSHPDFPTTPDHCMYSMHIYPSTSFEDSYNSNSPELSAGLVAATFFVVALIFLIYDMIVERKNRLLAVKAARSNAVVSALFPDAFQDRILDQHNTTPGNKPADHDWKAEGGVEKSIMDNGNNHDEVETPLAELYPHTSVLFADLVGFTQWSSTREPAQVFELLETIFRAFDKRANHLGVFKVETIGDCYVAVTGCPKPQEDHAVLMVKFARHILSKVYSVTAELVDSLGADTADLDLRVGIHSGSVTGGVLRGEKARFQLFGDTMNTAARMESNGIPGRIHVSQAMADELVVSGKSEWLTPRETKIVAKGKGEMQTYFVQIGVKGDNAVESVTSMGTSM